ncbi:hypothetical protein JVU11DRAFT_3946 [Chiua virens]|nr:hypothetical protein JVU11DRAFT_3946 [Chiua virens]
MPGWTLVNTHPIQGRTFERPLSPAEVAFILDARIKGSADSAQYFQLRLLNGSRDAYLFSNANILRAWISTKTRFPLAGATIRRPKTDGDLNDNLGPALQAHFVVQEHDLATVQPHEVIFEEVANAEELQAKEVEILDGPRALSEDLPVQPYGD